MSPSNSGCGGLYLSEFSPTFRPRFFAGSHVASGLARQNCRMPHTPRADLATSRLLHEALAMKRAFGLLPAVTFLRRRGISAELAARVLARKHDQRGYGITRTDHSCG